LYILNLFLLKLVATHSVSATSRFYNLRLTH